MNRADINRTIDPESLPLLSEDRGPTKLREQSDLDSLGLFDPATRGSIDEWREEPPWMAEFLAQYRLVFGSSSRISPPSHVHPEPIRVEARTAFPQPLRAETSTSVAQESAPGPAVASGPPSTEPLRSLPESVLGEWTWTQTVTALAIAALLGMLIALLIPRQHVNEKVDAADPVASLPVTKVEAVAPVKAIATDTRVASKESSHRSAGGQAAPLAGSSSAADSSDFPRSDEPTEGVPLRKVQPVYPSEALLRKLEGLVALQAEISQDGKVRAVTVVSGDPILARAAVVAVRQWTYPPVSSQELKPRQQQITIHFQAP